VSDVFQEVQEEYRRQQLAELWKKYSVPAIAGAVVLVLGVAGYQGWSYWRGEQALASSRSFDAGVKQLDADDNKAAADHFAKLSEKAVGGYAVLARLHEAATRGRSGEVDKAVAIYNEIARSSDPLFSGLAMLRATLLTVEKASLDETKKRLDPVIAGTGPWRPGALELLAYATWRACAPVWQPVRLRPPTSGPAIWRSGLPSRPQQPRTGCVIGRFRGCWNPPGPGSGSGAGNCGNLGWRG
jgi:hypothetical protein